METHEYNDLVGPRADDRGEKAPEDTSSDGRPLWEAFLDDPDAPVVSPNEVHAAKNAFDEAKEKHPDVIEMCQREPLSECIKSLKEAA